MSLRLHKDPVYLVVTPKTGGEKVSLLLEDDRENPEYLSIGWRDGDIVVAIETRRLIPELGEPLFDHHVLTASRAGDRILSFDLFLYEIARGDLAIATVKPNTESP